MSAITTINSSDLISASRSTINTNFSNLNTDKVEGAASSVDSEVALMSGTGGKTIKSATGSGIAKLTSGVLSVVTAPSGAIVGTSDSQTLTNKTLTSPIISTISNTGTLTLPTSTDTLVGRATTDTLTNKTLTSPVLTTPDLGTPSALVATNASGTANSLTSGITKALKSATTTVDVSAATAPSSGQVLTATSSTTATWQTPSSGGGWTRVANATFSAAFQISGLKGDTDKVYRLVLKVSKEASRFYFVRLNNDSGSNYKYGSFYNGYVSSSPTNTGVNSLSTTSIGDHSGAMDGVEVYTEFIIYAVTGAFRRVNWVTAEYKDANNFVNQNGSTFYTETATNLTTIDVAISGSGTFTGEYWLYKIN